MDSLEKIARVALETQQMIFLLLKTGCVDLSKLTDGQRAFFDKTLESWADDWRKIIADGKEESK